MLNKENSRIICLMQRQDSGWGSRDYCLPTISCKFKTCPCNTNEKCEMPSAISIDNSGKCTMAVKAKKFDNSNKKNDGKNK